MARTVLLSHKVLYKHAWKETCYKHFMGTFTFSFLNKAHCRSLSFNVFFSLKVFCIIQWLYSFFKERKGNIFYSQTEKLILLDTYEVEYTSKIWKSDVITLKPGSIPAWNLRGQNVDEWIPLRNSRTSTKARIIESNDSPDVVKKFNFWKWMRYTFLFHLVTCIQILYAVFYPKYLIIKNL